MYYLYKIMKLLKNYKLLNLKNKANFIFKCKN